MQKMYKNIFYKISSLRSFSISLIVFALVCSLSSQAQQNISISAKLSADSVLMGKTLDYIYELKNPSGIKGQIVVLDTIADIDIVPKSNREKAITDTFIVQPFTPGDYTLPAIAFVSGNDTIFSNKPTLTVTPVDVSHLDTINPNYEFNDVLEIDAKWYDSMPDVVTDVAAKYWWWILLAIIIIGGGIVAYLIYSKRIKVPFLTKKIEPPYEKAIRELLSLKDEHVWERGLDKEYYTRLTDTLRQYMHGRYGINAMEMTTPQLLEAIRSNEMTDPYFEEIKSVLEVSDFVKFAKIQPSPEENILAFDRVYDFVVSTKPVDPEDAKNQDPSDAVEKKDKTISSDSAQSNNLNEVK